MRLRVGADVPFRVLLWWLQGLVKTSVVVVNGAREVTEVKEAVKEAVKAWVVVVKGSVMVIRLAMVTLVWVLPVAMVSSCEELEVVTVLAVVV